MFNSTDELETGEFQRTVVENGGSDNAFTSWDYTAYHQTVAADRLGLMMQMEADRMRDLVLRPDEVATEIEVVLEERNERTDSSPGGLFNEQLNAAFYLNHPYGRPIIGWRHEIETLTLEHLSDWYETHYHPNNAILVVAGGVTAEEVETLAQEHYGPIPSNPDIEATETRIRPQEPPAIAARRFVLEDPRVANPYLMISYPAPERNSGDQQEAAALTLLRSVLGGSAFTSVFAETLELPQRSLFAGAYYSGTSLDPTEFTIVNMPAPGISLEQAEAELLAEVENFLENGIDPDRFETIQFRFRAGLVFDQDQVLDQANLYGRALTSGLTVEDVQAWPDVIANTTMEDVMDAARRLFAQDATVTGYLTVPAPDEAADEEVSQ